MALPKFGPKEFRNAALGLGALALTAIPLVSGPSFAEDGKNARTAASTVSASMTVPTEEDLNTVSSPGNTHRSLSGGTGSAQFTQAADREQSKVIPASVNDTTYASLGIPSPMEPTEARPFYTYNFDERMHAKHPDVSPLHLQAFEYDKILVYNFVDNSPEGRRFSQMQTHVLERTLAALAPRSEAKDIMLVNVVTNDAEGEPVYGAAFLALYKDENRLGPDGAPLENVVLPYGIVYGEPLASGNSHKLMDFALLNNVRTDADLNANANAISGSLYDIVHTYNQKKLASLDNNRPTLAGLQ